MSNSVVDLLARALKKSANDEPLTPEEENELKFFLSHLFDGLLELDLPDENVLKALDKWGTREAFTKKDVEILNEWHFRYPDSEVLFKRFTIEDLNKDRKPTIKEVARKRTITEVAIVEKENQIKYLCDKYKIFEGYTIGELVEFKVPKEWLTIEEKEVMEIIAKLAEERATLLKDFAVLDNTLSTSYTDNKEGSVDSEERDEPFHFTKKEGQKSFRRILKAIETKKSYKAEEKARRTKIIKISRYAAAAAIIIGGPILANFYLIIDQNKQEVITPAVVQITNDALPGYNRAVLTVGSNKSINLTSYKTGITVNNGIMYNDGEKVTGGDSDLVILHETQDLILSTPRGGQYQVVLPDGSKVWLNAASSIKFPSKFDGNSRKVAITGEAYLEVTKNTKQPFYVHTNKEIIQVLGTSFNLNAYEDEKAEKTTLIEGCIRVSGIKSANGDNQGIVLKAGESTIINSEGFPVRPMHKEQANPQEAIGWKNGAFVFNNYSVEQMMTQISRWYNVKVVYPNGKPLNRYTAFIRRNKKLSEVLGTIGLNFRINGNTVNILR